MSQLIIFTDLDGTLLDYQTYSFEAAKPALQLLKEKNVPLVICSSKTKKEILHYRRQLCNHYPFISENGGGIFIPKDYFSLNVRKLFHKKGKDDYLIIALGAKYSALRSVLEELKKEGFNVKGFGDMTVEEVAATAGLPLEEAEMAKERDFDEPFIFKGAEGETNNLLSAIKSKGFNYTRGRFLHVLGNSDKGKAVSMLIELYQEQYRKIMTIAIGDSPNDIPMLEKVDYPVIVQKPDGKYDPRIVIPHVIKAHGIGPDGWNKVVLDFLSRLLLTPQKAD